MSREEGGNGAGLVVGNGIDVAEASTRAETGGGDFGICGGVGAWWQGRATYVGDVGA